MISSLLETVDHLRNHEIVPELILAQEPSKISLARMQDSLNDSEITNANKGANLIIFKSLMFVDLHEYFLIAVVLRLEMAKFETNLIDLVDSSINNCQSIHSDFTIFITMLLKKIDPNSFGPGRDDVAVNYESKYAPYKAEVRRILDENYKMKTKYLEHFERILREPSAKSFRLDFLSIMYDLKLNDWDLERERINIVLDKFKRLDEASRKDPGTYFYLNSFSLVGSTYPQEVEVLKNEYFLKMMNMYLNCLLVLSSHQMKENLSGRVLGEKAAGFTIEEPLRQEPFNQIKFEVMLESCEEIFAQLRTLVDLNPTPFGFFESFGTEEEKLFTIENFFQSLFTSCTSESKNRLCQLYQEKPDFKYLFNIKEDLQLNPSKESLLRRTSQLFEVSFQVIKKSLLSVYGTYEKSKSKFKDSHFFLRSALVLKDYSIAFFKNNRSSLMIEKLTDYLNDEHFNRNIDIVYKFEFDLKLNYIFNNPAYKNNLRFEYFDLLSVSELENVKTFKKIERLAFKENNPMYLILSFKSMEFNLRELFRKVYKVTQRELDIVTAPDFGKNPEALVRLVNENEEINFVASDKKHYDIKSAKSLMNYVKSTAKSEIFDLVSGYIFEIYSAICHCYSFCRTKKLQFAKKFYEETTGGSPHCSSLTNLLEESSNDKDFNLNLNLEMIHNTLKAIHSDSDSQKVCAEFRKDYTTDLEKLLRNVLTDDYCNPEGKTKVNPFKVFDYVGSSLPKKKQKEN